MRARLVVGVQRHQRPGNADRLQQRAGMPRVFGRDDIWPPPALRARAGSDRARLPIGVAMTSSRPRELPTIIPA